MNYVKTVPRWQNNNPPFAVVPLGTGNDLSRSLGWGGGTDEQIDASRFLLEYVEKGKAEWLDRWKMTIRG